MEDDRNDVLKVRLCVVIFETISVRTKRYVALDTFEHNLTPLTEHTRHRAFVWFRVGQCLLWVVSSLPMLVEAGAGLPTGMDGRGSCPTRASISLIRVSRKFPPHEYRRMWLLTMVRSNRWKNLPHYQHLPHLRSCWRSNLDWQASKWAKVGMAAARPPVSWYVICLLVAVRIHYDVLYLILRQHTSLFHTRNLPFHLENVQHNTTATTQSQLTEILNLCEIRDENVSFPSLRTVIQLPVVMP